MKILDASAGLLTNFEVLDFLRNKGQTIEDEQVSETKLGDTEVGEDGQSERIKRRLTLSEIKVYEYLVNTAARDQTRESVSEFLQRCKKYKFAQADMLPIINIRPSQPSASLELYSITESFDRYESQADEIIQMIDEVLPPRPVITRDEEELVPLETLNQNEVNNGTEPQHDGPRSEPEPMLEG